MKLLSQFSLFILLFALIGCDSTTIQYPSVLLQADSLAMVNPEAALAMLDSLSPSMSYAKEPVRRYHSLLTIKARDKAFLPHKSDSLVLDLLDYYEKKGDAHLLPEAYYYAGRVTSDLGDAPQALDYFQKALDAIGAESQENTTIAILSYAQMGYLLRKQHLYDEARQCLLNSFSFDSSLQDTSRMSICLRDIAYIDMLQGKYEKSMKGYQRSEELALAINDSSRLFNTSIQKAKLLISLGRYDEAQECLDKYPKLLNKANKNAYYGVQADLYSKRGSDEEAYAYYKLLSSSRNLIDRSNANLWLASHSIKEKDATQAISYLSSVNRIEDSLRVQHNSEAVEIAHSLYNYSLKEKEILNLKYQETKNLYFSIFSLSVAIILGLVSILCLSEMRKRSNLLRIQNENLRYIVAQTKQKEKEEEEKKYNAMVSFRNSISYKLVQQKIHEEKKLSAEDWNQIEKDMDTFLPGFIFKLRGVYSFTQEEWQLSLLTKMDVPPQSIALLLCKSKDAIYARRSRLYNKVKQIHDDYSNWQDFIVSL